MLLLIHSGLKTRPCRKPYLVWTWIFQVMIYHLGAEQLTFYFFPEKGNRWLYQPPSLFLHDFGLFLLCFIGCGSGLSGETLSENGHRWIGLDISQSMLNVALEREVDGDLIVGDMGQGLGIRPGVIDGAISISAVQWLCNADKSSHEPRLRLKAFFGSLYRCLARGARAVFQVYPENLAQRELILGFAMRAGFAGGIVVDFPHSTKSRKEYLVLTCGPPSLSTVTPKGKGEDEESCSDDESSGDEENQTVCISDRHRPRKKAEGRQEGKGKRMGTEEERTDEEKGKCCASRFKVHSTQTKGSLLITSFGGKLCFEAFIFAVLAYINPDLENSKALLASCSVHAL
ncbi:hypothetical protein F0562_009142 [Nyssa sinensis]|uniref:Methyltransferase type 11 domain-containing protein n=1 Tax=Nyssa sinensis TaxID=561372 RepID=A0A5J4ZXZ7_9ASTE|nr:hypothetical protein F0562_009142 [Nyssa sinensis]